MMATKPKTLTVEPSAVVVPFNPLDKRNLGSSVAEAMLAGTVHSLEGLDRFKGAGIYALYYVGDFPAYSPLAERNKSNRFSAPIYVGKAVPEGSRQGLVIATQDGTSALRDRLRQHMNSIKAVEKYAHDKGTTNLKLSDFYCRYLVVDDVWIPLAESMLVARFSPIWNQFLDGFGNNMPGKGRHEGVRPRWDTLHPGRAWAFKHPERPETVEQITRDLANHFATICFPQPLKPEGGAAK